LHLTSAILNTYPYSFFISHAMFWPRTCMVNAFLIFVHVTFLQADGKVPVGRAGHNHLAQQEEVIERIESSYHPAAPG
jgi:hypothetical protein